MALKIEEYIQPLNINNMSGRVLHLPAPKKYKREILVIYGHHSTIERWSGLAEAFNDYGSVVMPDLPGFGGMDSFYSIGKPATLDNYADYLAAFFKMRYKRRRVTVAGISWGFLVITRMLQKYPELAKKIDMLVSAAGFMHADNFKFSSERMKMYRLGSRIISTPPIDLLFRCVGLNKYVLRRAYAKTHNAKVKFAQAKDKNDFDKMMSMEITLWQAADTRSHFRTTVEMLTVDNCTIPIGLPVWHVFTQNDNYFDNSVIEQQMRIVFDDFIPAEIKSASHVPSVVATKEEAKILIPRKLRGYLKAAQ